MVFLIGDKIKRTQSTIEAKHAQVQDNIGDSKHQSELLPSIEEVHEAKRDAVDDIKLFEQGPCGQQTARPSLCMDDKFISANVLLPVPRGEDVVRAKDFGRMHGRGSNQLGMRHSTPIMDTREYQI